MHSQSPKAGTFGNETRNLIRNPGDMQWDIAFFKNFALKGRSKVQFRTEIFNFLNHPNLSGPESNPTNANFGRSINKDGNRRDVQLSVAVPLLIRGLRTRTPAPSLAGPQRPAPLRRARLRRAWYCVRVKPGVDASTPGFCSGGSCFVAVTQWTRSVAVALVPLGLYAASPTCPERAVKLASRGTAVCARQDIARRRSIDTSQRPIRASRGRSCATCRRRGRNGDAPRHDVAELADRTGSRAAVVDALADGHPAGQGDERHRRCCSLPAAVSIVRHRRSRPPGSSKRRRRPAP